MKLITKGYNCLQLFYNCDLSYGCDNILDCVFKCMLCSFEK